MITSLTSSLSSSSILAPPWFLLTGPLHAGQLTESGIPMDSRHEQVCTNSPSFRPDPTTKPTPWSNHTMVT